MERKTKDYSIRGKVGVLNEGNVSKQATPQKPNIKPPPKPPKDRNQK